jgi:hypothetical protein
LKDYLKKTAPELSRRADLRSEDTNALLAPGKIEELVRGERIPAKIATISSSGLELKPYYQVPPIAVSSGEIKDIYFCAGGCYAFKLKNGKQLIGPTFTLTEERAQQIEKRVKTEEERLKTESLKRIKASLPENLFS